jgi:hypothetical protein
MDWMNKVGGILQQYSESASSQGAESRAPGDVSQHFDNVSQAVPQNVLAQGLSEAFHSNQTPSFGQMVGNLFRQSDPEQKTGILNKLLAAAGPSASAWLASKGLSGLVNGPSQVNPQAVTQVSPETVSELANDAQNQSPSIVDEVSGFYAQHPTLVKGLGAAALAIAMSKMSRAA